MDGKIALYRECCFPNCTKSWWIKFKRKSSTDRSFCENTRHICGVQVTSFLIIVCCFAFSIIVIAHRKRKAPKYKLWGDERSWRGWNNPPITGATILNVGVCFLLDAWKKELGAGECVAKRVLRWRTCYNCVLDANMSRAHAWPQLFFANKDKRVRMAFVWIVVMMTWKWWRFAWNVTRDVTSRHWLSSFLQ